jgi:hypothetical protein
MYIESGSVKDLNGYVKPSTFAKTYVKTKGQDKGKKGVNRVYINQLIKEERLNPGTTGIDVLCIDGVYYVRHSK